MSGLGGSEPAMMAGNLDWPWALSGSHAQGLEQILQTLVRHRHAQLLDLQVEVQAGE
ncbi:hypothetical protein D3C84_1052210 [compost metagenome]